MCGRLAIMTLLIKVLLSALVIITFELWLITCNWRGTQVYIKESQLEIFTRSKILFNVDYGIWACHNATHTINRIEPADSPGVDAVRLTVVTFAASADPATVYLGNDDDEFPRRKKDLVLLRLNKLLRLKYYLIRRSAL